MSRREQALAALFGRLQTIPQATVKRILRDGDPGEPDITLNPVHLFYSHRAEIEAFVSPPAAGGGEARLDALLGEIGAALAADRSLGGLVENLFLDAPTIEPLVIEGAAPILAARFSVVIEYLVSDPLAAA
jgi:hypothetical protein